MSRSLQGLTLIDVLVILIVLAILAAMLMPVVDSGGGGARKAVCKSNLKQLGLAMAMYINDYDGYFPARGLGRAVGQDDLRGLGSLCLLYDQYITAKKIYRCPSTTDDPTSPTVGLNIDPVAGLQTAQPAGCSYGYDSQKAGAAKLGLEGTMLSAIAIAADKPDPSNRLRNSANHGNTGQNVLYFDGHVEWGPTRNVGLRNDDIWNAQEQGKPLAWSDSYITQ